MDKLEKKHFEGFEYLRVIASFSVVWIHTSFTNPILIKWNLNGFPVPCFLMMSIFLLGFKINQSKRLVIKSLLKRILPQYIFWTLIYLVTRFLKAEFLNEEFVIGFNEIFLGGSAVQLWFLPAIIIFQIVMLYIYNYKNLLLDLTLCTSLFVCGFLFNFHYATEWSFINFFTFNMGFIVIGKITFFYYQKLSKSNIKNLRYILAIIVVLIIYETYLNFTVYEKFFTNVVYSIVIFILFTVGNFTKSKIVTGLSKYSFGIYLSHFLFYQFFYTILKICNIEIGLAITVLNILLTYISSYLFCLVIDKNKYLKKVI